ncbi:MAG: DUF3618 domain-containing protein [Candidatus Nanopelagicales bacterium]
MTDPSTVDLQAELAAAREELAASIAELKAQASPGAIAERGKRAVTGFFTTAEGGVNVRRVAIVGGVVIGIVAIKLLRRR